MFNQQELQILIGGVEEPVDVDDLMRNSVYGGVFDESHATIQRFWKVSPIVSSSGFWLKGFGCRSYARSIKHSGNPFYVS